MVFIYLWLLALIALCLATGRMQWKSAGILIGTWVGIWAAAWKFLPNWFPWHPIAALVLSFLVLAVLIGGDIWDGGMGYQPTRIPLIPIRKRKK